MLADAHCHFFSPNFFRTLAAEVKEPTPDTDPAESLPKSLGWDPPVGDEELADRWRTELDRHHVDRAMLIASVPGDEASVAAAVRRHPDRLTGAFMFNPASDTRARLEHAFGELGLRTACLFPAMHRVPIDDDRSAAVFEVAERHGRAVFVHCGALSIGVRKKLGLPSRFDLRLGDPLAVAAVAAWFPGVPVIIPHFGAGLFREALMAAHAAPNIVLDTSSSNDWVRLHGGLTLRDVFARALDWLGPERLMFGTDSSFFPRGWQRGIADIQRAILEDLGVAPAAQALVFGGNFARLLGGRAAPSPDGATL
ncbi:MAG TPA: amidohydrolase family protein [Vicinamibacterales bacterium]|nr:amidohydrolase family protein [Vicinamibacterales bacterium]